jgi:hypothetical protein
MADRTHEAEDEMTGGKATARATGGHQTPAVPHVYQEGSVDSIGERPTDADRGDRSGQGETSEAPRGQEDVRRDEFISSEVSDRTSRPMRNSKTQS